jgi:predicted alpha/beta hydrolase family esterase
LDEVERLYIVAPPSLKCNIDELKSFFPLDMPTNPHAKETTMVVSTDDPYITMDEAQELKKSLKAKINILQNAGHINSDSGFGKWEWILQDIKTKNDT